MLASMVADMLTTEATDGSAGSGSSDTINTRRIQVQAGAGGAGAAGGAPGEVTAHEIFDGRFSINLIAFYAADLVHMAGLVGAEGERAKPTTSEDGVVRLGRVIRNDEEEMSVTIPDQIGRQNAIYHGLVVAHLSSSQQEAKTIVNGNCYDTGVHAALSEEPMPVKQLLELYTALADVAIGIQDDVATATTAEQCEEGGGEQAPIT
jgi:hypothetical protein